MTADQQTFLQTALPMLKAAAKVSKAAKAFDTPFKKGA